MALRRDGVIKVGVTTGDLNGIGLELFIRTFSKPGMETLCTPILFGSTKSISYYKKVLGSDLKVMGIDTAENAISGRINCVNIWQKPVRIEMGTASRTAGAYAFKSLQAATQALSRGSIDVLVTAPVDKHSIHSDAFSFPGHTEYLQSELAGESLMFLVSERLKLAVVTGHIPLSQVTQSINREAIRDGIGVMSQTLVRDFVCHKPKIAVLSLNPHAGDRGLMGDQDQQIVAPVIDDWFDRGLCVFGPYPADGFFGSGMYRDFDGVLAMYHDQGLIPFKTLAFDEGVNFTAGLNRIRTAPDHGTAYDLVGKGVASTGSYERAIFTAIEIYGNRKMEASDSKSGYRSQHKVD